MGLGSTAKKVQQIVDLAETLHARIMDVKQGVEGTQETVEETANRVAAMEDELAEQRELLETIAGEHNDAADPDVPDAEVARDDGNA